jgi:hypothetical protein
MDPLVKPAERLKLARSKAGFETAEDFALAHNIPLGTYGNHESGGRGIRPDVAQKYASLLGNCSANWILYGEGPSPSDENGGSWVPEIDRESEEMAAFMLLFDRVTAAAQQYEQAMKEEFGFIPRLFGYVADDTRGAVQIAFYLWRQIVNQQNDLTLTERVLGRLHFLESSMARLAETFREVGRAMKGPPPAEK